MDNFEYTKMFDNIEAFKTLDKNSAEVSDIRIVIRLDKSVMVMYNIKQQRRIYYDSRIYRRKVYHSSVYH